MEHKSLLLFAVAIAGFAATANATNQGPKLSLEPKPATPGSTPGSCPAPTDELLACMRQWACQSLLRLDLRCLLNLNGLPLVGGLLGSASSPSTSGLGAGVPGAAGGGGLLGSGLIGGGNGLLGTLLG